MLWFGAHAIGYSIEAYNNTTDSTSGFSLTGGPAGVAFTVVGGLVVIALTIAALLTDLKRHQSA